MADSNNTQKLREIRDEVLALSQSPLYQYRVENHYVPVIGQGNHNADLMFVGEAPGEKEALSGVPFCGASGRMLDELLASISLNRTDVYIANLVKDRPPKNRDPKPEEISLYSPFLDRQIDIIQPKVIITLGRLSMQYIMEKFDLGQEFKPISKIHGMLFNTQASYGDLKILPLYHPAVALYNGGMKSVLIEDFKKVKKVI